MIHNLPHESYDCNLPYDLRAALEYNDTNPVTHDNVAEILAFHEGKKDSPDYWHWLLLLTDNKIAYLTGGCDYTGWDCQSWLAPVKFVVKDLSWTSGTIPDTHTQIGINLLLTQPDDLPLDEA